MRAPRSSTHDRESLLACNSTRTPPGWTDVDGGDIDPGRSFTENENDEAAQVVIVNDKMAEALFDQGEAVGKVIAIGGSRSP